MVPVISSRPSLLVFEEEAFQFPGPQQPAANSLETGASASSTATVAYTESDPDAMQVASGWPWWAHEHSVEMPVPGVLDKPPMQMGYALPRTESTSQC